MSVCFGKEGVEGSGFVQGPLGESPIVGNFRDDGTSKNLRNRFSRASGAADSPEHGLQFLIDERQLCPLLVALRCVVPDPKAFEAVLLFKGYPGGLPAGVIYPKPFVRCRLSEIVLTAANVICAEFLFSNTHAGECCLPSNQFGLPLKLGEGGGERL